MKKFLTKIPLSAKYIYKTLNGIPILSPVNSFFFKQ